MILDSFSYNNIKSIPVGLGVVVGHDGSIYWYTKANKAFRKADILLYDKLVVQHVKLGYNEVRAQEIALSEFAKTHEFIFRKGADPPLFIGHLLYKSD